MAELENLKRALEGSQLSHDDLVKLAAELGALHETAVSKIVTAPLDGDESYLNALRQKIHAAAQVEEPTPDRAEDLERLSHVARAV